MLKTFELLAPGGSLDQAVQALRAGADAVYCGAPRFSARSHAKNLDFPQLRRLCGEAAARSGGTGHTAKIYLALNTIIRAEELAPALESAWRAWEAGVSALIVQDLGLMRTLQQYGPQLPLHASTQMAIHSALGAAAARDLGFKRVVLARELTLAEIAAIISAVPELEYECFIHGAMCYSVSGICLASGLLLGRSGNRGDCGQVCRTWSRLDDSGASAGSLSPPKAGFWFSMNDMSQSAAIREMAAAGVHSFKIEGRMKPPEWTAAVVRHYRQLLDNPVSAPDQASLEESRTVFGREPSTAYLHNPRGTKLINNQHAGTIGLAIGPIMEARGNRILVKTAVPLAVKDGIQLIRPGQPPEVLRVGIQGLETPVASVPGRPGPSAGNPPKFSCQAGETVWITSSEARFVPADRGLVLSKIADHASNLPAIKAESLPLHHHALVVGAKLTGDVLSLSTRIATTVPVELTFSLSVTASESAAGLAASVASQLAKADDSPFSLDKLEPDASLSNYFVPPSELKAARRAWYAALSEAFELMLQGAMRALADDLVNLSAPGRLAGIAMEDIPPRSQLSPRQQIPFAINPASDDLASWQHDGQEWLVLPLPPVVFDEEAYLSTLKTWMAGLPAGRAVLLGLNNLAHLSWYRELRRLAHESRQNLRLAAFGDYSLYVANPLAAHVLQEQIADLLWLTPWVEEPSLAGQAPGDQGAKTGDPDFHPPLFISRACFRRASLGLGCPSGGPEACAKRFEYHLRQGNKDFTVIVRDCLSYTFGV